MLAGLVPEHAADEAQLPLSLIGDVCDATLDPTRQNETAYIWEEQR
jgi:hypothetical protein